MSDNPISQLPEPYRAAWEIMQQSVDLETVLKNTLSTAIAIARADSGMIVLKSESELYGSTPAYRTLPDMKRKYIYERDLSLLDYGLALEVANTLKSKLIPNTGDVSFEEKQILNNEFLSGRRFRFANEVSDRVETHQTLLLIPIFTDGVAAGAIVLSRPIELEPFSQESLLSVEFFVSLVSNYVCAVVAHNDLAQGKSEFVSVVAYEIKNSLTSIIGYTKELLGSDKYGALTDIQRRFLETIQQNGKRINRFISNLNDATKLEVSQIRLQLKTFNVGSAILEVYEEFKPELNAKKQFLKLELENHVFVYGDKLRTEQAISELIRNSSLYSPEGSTLGIIMDVDENYVRVSITDSGVGLTSEEKPHLFEKFYRSDRDSVRAESGYGLGLSIAKYLIEMMGGQIGAEGSPNQGSTFWFTLPVATN